ncbi:hypothetical protein Fleli_1619 [Bernardetia litoralis DSM 6794]|uniref:Uncharacterized protein n=1 Tax=Bernardetia litoralis (strain ATCC 23117 / DSM 6794 / NBRC 15988 / NCIMB 1366 / Fx l1 / Sio-4) TaxID=880071 RepID=I4AJ99_BERLS|nr:hypothetical protein [Bernardetia litoralis]AFM04034.1 hypothetical protein Fleli_1619 [Bernardetia litoralis DSM 6794]
MKFLEYFIPTKDIIYQTSLSPQKVIVKLESKISPKPKRKSIFDIIPLTYHGKIEGNNFEFGRYSRGQKDHPPTAYGKIEENPINPLQTLIKVNIIPNQNFKTGVVLFLLLILVACLPTFFSILNNYYDSIGYFIFLPCFFSFGGLANYLIFKNYNNRLAKDIQGFVDGKIIK